MMIATVLATVGAGFAAEELAVALYGFRRVDDAEAVFGAGAAHLADVDHDRFLSI